MTSYDRYKHACEKYGYSHVGEQVYWEMIKLLSDHLQKRTRDPSGDCPYIIYNVRGLRIKVKLIRKDAEINFFSEEQYREIISKYKDKQ